MGLELRCNLDDLDALSADREALWARLDGASFLTRDEKRAAAGYGPAKAGGAKFNPYHDSAGRFTFAPGGGVTPVAAPPRGPKGPPAAPPSSPPAPAPKPPPPAATTPPKSQPDFLAKRPGPGKLTGSFDGLKPAEQNFAKEMVGLGKNVEVIPTGAGRTADFKIDGKTYELKTVSGVQKTDTDGLSSAISSRVMDGRGQAGDIIVDARQQQGMTRAIGERAAGRAYGADNASGKRGIKSITILTPEGAVSTIRNN